MPDTVLVFVLVVFTFLFSIQRCATDISRFVALYVVGVFWIVVVVISASLQN